MSKVLITTSPFGEYDKFPIEMLEKCEVDYVLNPFKRRVTEEELGELIQDIDILIAGTEKISEAVLSRAKNLRLISRVGIGLDGIDLTIARRKGIKVTYTPDAPAPAVAELTLGMMLALLRRTQEANVGMHAGEWDRLFGRRICDVTIGIIGFGRIGQLVAKYLISLGARNILLNDVKPEASLPLADNMNYVSKEEIMATCDIVSVHVPLTNVTHHMIGTRQLAEMKDDAILINTARGGIVDETALLETLSSGKLSGVGLDVFESEPYSGPFRSINRCLLTCHMGSMSVDCRTKMEIEATSEAVRFLRGEPLLNPIPDHEYDAHLGISS